MKILKEMKERATLYESHMEAVYDDSDMFWENDITQLEQLQALAYVDSLPIIKSPYILYGMGVLMGALLISPNHNYAIIVDDLFNELSLNAKKFVINHELGHYNLGHLKQFENENTKKGLLNKMKLEYEADNQSAKVIGYKNTIKAINEIIELINKATRKDILNSINLCLIKHTLNKRKRHLIKMYICNKCGF